MARLKHTAKYYLMYGGDYCAVCGPFEPWPCPTHVRISKAIEELKKTKRRHIDSHFVSEMMAVRARALKPV